MQEKQVAGLFLEIFVIVVILGLLLAITIPHLGQMMSKSKPVSPETEFQNTPTEATEMRGDSDAGTLEPIGPAGEISQVHTCGMPPPFLSDYLLNTDNDSNELSYFYSLATNGTVNQIVP